MARISRSIRLYRWGVSPGGGLRDQRFPHRQRHWLRPDQAPLVLAVQNVRFAMDSALEGDEFELSVPRQKDSVFEAPSQNYQAVLLCRREVSRASTPAGAGELGGRAKQPVSVKGELRGDRTRAAKSCFFMGSNPRSGSAEARVYPRRGRCSTSKERSRRESVVIQTPFSLSPKWIGECADDHLEGAIVCPMQAPSSTPLATARPRARETSR
jgi:hypothetical protein